MSNFGIIQSIKRLPMDSITGWLGAWSLIRLKATYIAAALTIRRSSDNATTNVFFDSSGDISATSVVSAGGSLSTWAGASTLYITSLIDLTGNGRNATQATSAYQPLLILSALNGHAVMRFSGTQALYLSSALNTEFNTFFCLTNIASSANRGVIFGNYQSTGNTQNSAVEKNASNQFRVFYNAADLAISASNAFGQIRVGSFVRNTSTVNTSVYINNTIDRSVAAVNGTVINDVPHGMGADQRSTIPSSGVPLTGDMATIMIHSTGFNTDQRMQITRTLGRLGGLNI